MAHRTGWYMAAYIDEFGNFLSSWGVRNLYTIHSSFGSCDQIWAGRIRNGMYDKLPSTEPFTDTRQDGQGLSQESQGINTLG